MNYRKVTAATAFSIAAMFVAGPDAQAKWFFFGKADKVQNEKLAAAAYSEIQTQKATGAGDDHADLQFGQNRAVGGRTVQTKASVTRATVDRPDHDDGMDILESTLNMPMTLLQPLKGTQKGLESLQNPLRNLSEPIKKLEPPLKQLDGSIKELEQPLKGLNGPLSGLKETTSGLQQPIKSVGTEISGLRRPINELKQPLDDLKKPLTDLGQPVQDLSKPISALSHPISGLSKPLQEVSGSLDAVKEEIQLLREEIGGIKSTVAQIVFYVLCMVTVLCVTALAVLLGLFVFISKRKRAQ
ncbi:MAG: hypothetical protein AB7W16_05635 [Candidatus Obscuribacterales bacterium]